MEVYEYTPEGDIEQKEFLEKDDSSPYLFSNLETMENGELEDEVDLNFFDDPENHPGFVGGKDE